MRNFLFAIHILICSISFSTFALELDIDIDAEKASSEAETLDEGADTKYEKRNNKKNPARKSTKKKEASDDKKKEKKRKRSESSQSDSSEETKPSKKKKRTNNNELPSKKKHACSFEGCTRVFTKKGQLTAHMKRHLNPRAHPCPFEGCTSAFPIKSELTRHMERHSNNKPHVCSFRGCTKAFSTKPDLTKHSQRHGQVKPFVCPIEGCGKAFALSDYLTKHLKVHKRRKLSQEKARVLCPVLGCGKTFTVEGSLKSHMKIHTGEMDFACTFDGCLKVCRLKTTLATHMKRHEGPRPYACIYKNCPKSFATKAELINHKHEVIKKEPEVANQRKTLITKANIKEELPAVNPGLGKNNCGPIASNVHNWLTRQTLNLKPIDHDVVEKGNITFITTRDGSEEYGTITDHLVAREMASPKSSEHIIDDEQSSCHIHKPKFIKKNNSELESYIESLPKKKFEDGNYYIAGILYWESKKKKGKGHFLNFYSYSLDGDEYSYIIDGQNNSVKTVRYFLDNKAKEYKDDVFIWHDNGPSLVAVTAHWEDQSFEELVEIKKEPNSDEEEPIHSFKKPAKRKNSVSDLNKEPLKRYRHNKSEDESGRTTNRKKSQSSDDSNDEDYVEGKRGSKKKTR